MLGPVLPAAVKMFATGRRLSSRLQGGGLRLLLHKTFTFGG